VALKQNADRVVGLDVGTGAVRLADVESGARRVLRAFGQVDLPPGGVVAGEVVDVDAVAEAIRQLWRETGVRQRTVRVGVASERVVVRTIELAAVPDNELADALRFQAQDYITIPIDEAVLDFHILERVSGPDGEPLVRILLAAAHRETVGALLEAVKQAGITASGVDLVPLALIRGLRPAGGEPGSAEAIVSVGAGVITVVVHEAGLPRMVRIVAAATGGGPADPAEFDADLAAIIGPVHGSLDHYLNQSDAPPLTKVVLTGGGSLTEGLADALAASLFLPVEQARPRDAIDVGDIGIPEALIPDVDPYLPVAVGLALGGQGATGALIDLLPPEARREAKARQTMRRAVAGAAAVAAAMAGLSLVQAAGAAGQRGRLAHQERTNHALQTQIETLSGALQGEQDLASARQRITVALTGDVSWPRVLDDLAATLPEGVWLTTLSLQPGEAGAAPTAAPAASPAVASAAPTGSEAAAEPGSGATMGTASFGATAVDFPAVATWLDRLPRVPYYIGLSVSTATKAEGGPRPLVTFTSGAKFGPAARSDRLQRILGPQL
jgi:type IV pilus assembly protein PilM